MRKTCPTLCDLWHLVGRQAGRHHHRPPDSRRRAHHRVWPPRAQVRQAYLEHARTTLIAPVTGYVAKRTVQLGQRVQPGTALMAVIPLNQLWIDANFKETQLHQMRIGQPVDIESDIYGSDVKYSGTVDSIGAGTGSAFALLPAQNATGNWIKIVQRVQSAWYAHVPGTPGALAQRRPSRQGGWPRQCYPPARWWYPVVAR